jgi:hypothetical protein
MILPMGSTITEDAASSWWQRIWRGTRRLYGRGDWARFAGADWAEQIWQAQVTDDFHAKQGRSTGRWVLHDAGETLAVYLKRHYRLPWWQGLLTTIWPKGNWSPGFQEFHNLQWAHAQGLPVPRVVAAGEYLKPLGRLQSFLAIEELTGMLALHEAIPLARRQLDGRLFAAWKAGLAREMARLTRLLHQRHYYHKDLYLCHFYVPRADTWTLPEWPGRVHMIDFHRLGHHALTWPWWRIKDLAKLLYSSDVAGVNARDRLRFWRHYLEPTRRRGARWLAWLIRLKGERYRQHNAKKKA